MYHNSMYPLCTLCISCDIHTQVLYIDLDAHQGNGVERDKLTHADSDLFIIDVYNATTFPADREAEAAIDIDVGLRPGTAGRAYLGRLDAALARATAAFPSPDLVFYNAGSDILEGDPLGGLAVEEASVVARDEAVWRYALETAKCPIVMTLSGGYAPRSAAVVTDSLANLITTFGLNVATTTSGAAAAAATTSTSPPAAAPTTTSSPSS